MLIPMAGLCLAPVRRVVSVFKTTLRFQRTRPHICTLPRAGSDLRPAARARQVYCLAKRSKGPSNGKTQDLVREIRRLCMYRRA
jgi:hypothetical protein